MLYNSTLKNAVFLLYILRVGFESPSLGFIPWRYFGSSFACLRKTNGDGLFPRSHLVAAAAAELAAFELVHGFMHLFLSGFSIFALCYHGVWVI